MEPLLLVLVIVVFILPSFLAMRSQRRRQNELQTMQASLGVGDRVVTVSGIHGTIVTAAETQVQVEIATDVVVTMDRIAVMRKATPEDLGAVADDTPAAGGQTGYQQPRFPEHPENHPDGGHPENS